MAWKKTVERNGPDWWSDDKNQWLNREWTWEENITIREIDLSVMNDGKVLVEWFVPVTSRLIVAVLSEAERKWSIVTLIDSAGRHKRDHLHFHYSWDWLLSPAWFETHTQKLTPVCSLWLHVTLSDCDHVSVYDGVKVWLCQEGEYLAYCSYTYSTVMLWLCPVILTVFAHISSFPVCIEAKQTLHTDTRSPLSSRLFWQPAALRLKGAVIWETITEGRQRGKGCQGHRGPQILTLWLAVWFCDSRASMEYTKRRTSSQKPKYKRSNTHTHTHILSQVNCNWAAIES